MRLPHFSTMPHTAPPRRLSLVAAMSENRVLGANGDLPWSLPDEMAQFRAFTLGHAVIMGRTTFEAGGGKPLPHRRNLVLTRQKTWAAPEGVEVFTNLDAALSAVQDDCEPFITGGAEIYHLALPHIDRMYLTTIHATLEGDTFFPDYDDAQWHLTDARHHPADPRHAHAFTVRTLDRKR